MAKSRVEHFLPGGVPKYIACYEHKTYPHSDKWTLIFTRIMDGYCHYISCNHIPTSPNMGIWMHGESKTKLFHLGTRIKFSDLPAEVQTLAITEYKEIWRLE